MNENTATVVLTYATLADMSAALVALRWSHPLTRGEYMTSQMWTWEDGEAMVVVVGSGIHVVCYGVIRHGSEFVVAELRRGIAGWLLAEHNIRTCVAA